MSAKKKCKGCGEYWRPEADTPPWHKWCSDPCREEVALKELERVRKSRKRSADNKKKNEKSKNAKLKKEYYENDVPTRRKAAVLWFNKFIRLRDFGKPCISCGKPHGSSKIDCGHYITAGSCTALRFNEFNCNAQCHWDCNIQQSGNIVGYRKGLIERYGQEVVDFLEGPQPAIKITVDWYKSIEEAYKAKCKRLEEK